MRLLLLSNLLFVGAVLAGAFTGFLYWERTFGSCADGCPQGMVFILFMPAALVAIGAFILAPLFRVMSQPAG
ncbi:MAG: hypothetical protein AAFR04_01495 [Pseudomonadota bacterium]